MDSATRSPTSAPLLSRKPSGSPCSLKRGRSPSPDDAAKPPFARREKKKVKLLASGRLSANQQHRLQLFHRQKKVLAAPLRNAFRKQVLNVVPPLQETSSATEVQLAAAETQQGCQSPTVANANLTLPSFDTNIPVTTRIANPGQLEKSGPVPMPSSSINSSSKWDAPLPLPGNLGGNPPETLGDVRFHDHDKLVVTRARLTKLDKQYWHPYPRHKREVKNFQVPFKNKFKSKALVQGRKLSSGRTVRLRETELMGSKPMESAMPVDTLASIRQVHLKEPAIGDISSEECEADDSCVHHRLLDAVNLGPQSEMYTVDTGFSGLAVLPDANKTLKPATPSIDNLPVEFQNSGVIHESSQSTTPSSDLQHQIGDVFDLGCHPASPPRAPLKRRRSQSPDCEGKVMVPRSARKKPKLMASGTQLTPSATKQRLLQLLHRQRKVTTVPKTAFVSSWLPNPGFEGGKAKVILQEQETAAAVARVQQAYPTPDSTHSDLPSFEKGIPGAVPRIYSRGQLEGLQVDTIPLQSWSGSSRSKLDTILAHSPQDVARSHDRRVVAISNPYDKGNLGISDLDKSRGLLEAKGSELVQVESIQSATIQVDELPSHQATESTEFATLEDLPEPIGQIESLEGSPNGSEKYEPGNKNIQECTGLINRSQGPSEICAEGTAEKQRPPGIAERGVVVELHPDPAVLLLRPTEPEEHGGVRQSETSAYNLDISEKERREEFQIGGSLDSKEVEERLQCESDDGVDESGSSGMCIDDDEGKTSGPHLGLSLNSGEVYDRLVRYPDLPCTNAPMALMCELLVDLKSTVESLRRSTEPETSVTESAVPAESQRRSNRRGYGSTTQTPITAQNRDKKRQPPFLVNLKADVRRLMHEFLEYPEKDLTVPAPAQLKQYKEKGPSAQGPSLNPLVLDLASKGPSDWNKKAAKTFRGEFLSLDLSDCKDEDLIEATFLKHVDYLRKVYLKQSLDIGGKVDAARRAKEKAKYARRKELRERRFKTALLPYQTISEMKTIRATVSKFPMEVVSEDEREVVEGKEHYLVVKPDWRSSDGENLCEILDALHMASHFTVDDRPRPGRFSHLRTASNRLYTGPAPPGLPSNLYKSEYVESLTPEEVDDLNVQPKVVLSFPARIMRIAARFRHIECRGTAPLPRNDPSLNVYVVGETYSAFIE